MGAERSPIDDLPATIKRRLHKSLHPQWVPPMLATLVAQPFSQVSWLFEAKLDGERCLTLRDRDQIHLLSRNRKRLNDKYPELLTAFRDQNTERFAADGEIVTFDGAVTSFAKLQQRMQVSRPSDELRRRVPVWIYLFDVLHLDGYDTRQLPLIYRKRLLTKALKFDDPVRFTEHQERDGERYYHEACKRGWEGIMAKKADSVYVSARSRDWLKFKCTKDQEFVIGGYTDPKGSRVGFGALLVGYYKAAKLVYAGKVGTGFDEKTLRRLGKELAQLKIKANPFALGAPPHRGVHWVKPQLVAQIGFTEWTHDGKLRHPRFLGLRSDKSAKEVIKEQ